MKTIALTGIRQLKILEVPEPKIEHDDDVLIKVAAVGICGSDVHYYNNGRIGSRIVKYPFTVGHEGAGIVEKTGRTVKKLKRGRRVAIEPAISCGKCDQCRSSRQNTCRNLRFMSCPGEALGFFSEKVVLPERNCYPVSDDLSMELAAFAEPLSIGIYAAKFSIPMKGARAAILGAGPIGLSVLLAAIDGGAEKIYVTDKISKRLQDAAKLGATWVGNPENEDIVKKINHIEPLQLDAVFECCGEQEALNQAMSILKPGGKLMILGIPEVERITFDPDTFRRKEITIAYVRRQNKCMPAALSMIAENIKKISSLITHRFPMNRSKEAFELVSKYEDGVVKATILF